MLDVEKHSARAQISTHTDTNKKKRKTTKIEERREEDIEATVKQKKNENCLPIRSFRTHKINIVPSHCLHINIFQMVRDNARERCRTKSQPTAVDGVFSVCFLFLFCLQLRVYESV